MQVIHKDEEDGNGAENDLTITAMDTTNGFDVTFKGLESTGEGAQFFPYRVKISTKRSTRL